jgi:HK97 family phage portal protein
VTVLPNGRLAYDVVAYTASWGGKGTPRRLLAGEVLHVRDRSDDGYVGRSRLNRAPAVLSSAIGLQTYSGAVWQNAATPSGVVTVPAGIKKDDFNRMRESFEQAYTGAQRGGRVVFADAESRFTPLQISPEAAEVLASRRFTVEEMCRLWNVPPPIVQSYEFNTFTNSAQANTWFAMNTLRPVARKIEAEFSRSVFGAQDDHHIEIDLSGLMRGDYATRWTANVAAVEAGILTADEVREAEGYAPRSSQDPALSGGPAPGTD